MKRAFIVHGWDGSPAEGWFPWLKAGLEKRGFAVQVPAMPNAAHPTIEEWVPFLAAAVGKADRDTYLVGHSIGCQTILRYLASLPTGAKVGGIVLVAGFLDSLILGKDEEKEIAAPWLAQVIDTAKVKGVTSNIAALFSENDKCVPMTNKKAFEERLGAQTFLGEGGNVFGHFTGADGITELPKVLELLLAMSAMPTITIDEFSKMELRMGKILSAEKIEGADKLYKLSVDMGGEVRTICSGVAQFYQPEELVGKTVPVITNLAPRVMRGVESRGMILMADNDGPVLLTPIREVPPGSLVK